MYQILDNIRITRKHSVTHILNEQGGLMWSGKSTGEAIVWMLENDIKEAKLIVDQQDYELNFSRFPI